LDFSGNVDSSKYHFNSDKEVVLSQLNKQDGDPNDSVIMQVFAISDTVLKLEFNENTSSSTITLRRERD